MKLAIIGSRSFKDERAARGYFNLYYLQGRIIDGRFGWESRAKTIISGGAAGADTCAKELARLYDIPLVEYLPDWAFNGRAAGFVRNKKIISEADEVLAFWDGKSKGTANSLDIARQLRKPTVTIYI